MNFGTILLTGLTTGGVTCLAMQGGLLASAIANQKDEEIEKSEVGGKKSGNERWFETKDALPVSMFMLGKLISHTIFGILLGFLGSKLELSLTLRLVFQTLAALFMLATAANLLELHPIFRYVVFQPPKFFTRLVRGSTKSKAMFAPFVVGFSTILVPCGVTQSMEVLAMTSGNAITGGLVMAVFVLGTLPIFGLVGIGVAKFTDFWQGTFLKVAAAMLVLLSISSINGVLTVMDSPITLSKIKVALLDPAGIIYTQDSSRSQVVDEDGKQKVTVNVLAGGYSPNRIKVKVGVPVEMTLVANNVYSCASEFVFPAFGIKARLRPTDEKKFEFTPTKKGRYTFSCAMGMYTGVVEAI